MTDQNSKNSQEYKSVPNNWDKIIDAETIEKSTMRIAYEILEKGIDPKQLAIVGIHTGGEFLARRIHAAIEKIEKFKPHLGVIDITLYRDDLSHHAANPILKATNLPFDVDGSHLILVDDIFYTGRTIRAALDAIVDFGRPNCIELAVLIDRGHRELPIRADYVGKNIPTKRTDFMRLRLEELGYQDAVYLISGEDKS